MRNPLKFLYSLRDHKKQVEVACTDDTDVTQSQNTMQGSDVDFLATSIEVANASQNFIEDFNIKPSDTYKTSSYRKIDVPTAPISYTSSKVSDASEVPLTSESLASDRVPKGKLRQCSDVSYQNTSSLWAKEIEQRTQKLGKLANKWRTSLEHSK